MAKKRGKDEEKLNYSAAVRELKADGPERLYLLWGRRTTCVSSISRS